MDATTPQPQATAPEPPELPAVLLQPWPVIVAIATGWLVAVVLAFTVPGLHDWRPTTVVTLDEGRAAGLLKLIDALEENDDVQNVYANFDIPDSVMARLSAA